MDISLVIDYSKSIDLKSNLNIIKKTGFTHINLPSYFICDLLSANQKKIVEFKKLIDDYGLKIDWVHAPFLKLFFWTDDSELRAMSIATIKKIFDVSEYLNANSVIIHPVNDDYPDDIFNIEYRNKILDAFYSFVEYAESLNINPAIENLINKNIHQLTLFILDNIKNLKFCFDAGHAEISKTYDLYLPKYLNRLCALHIHDNDGKEDLHLIPGDGIIDFNNLFNNLLKDYKGVIGIESLQWKTDFFGSPEFVANKIFNNIKNFKRLS